MPKSKHKTRRYQLSRRLTPSHGKIVSALIIFFFFLGNYDRRRKETARFRNSNPIDFGFSIRQISKYHSDAIKIAIITSMTPDKKRPKAVRIKNTVERSEIERSDGCLPQVEGREDIKVVSEAYKWKLTPEGDFWTDVLHFLAVDGADKEIFVDVRNSHSLSAFRANVIEGLNGFVPWQSALAVACVSGLYSKSGNRPASQLPQTSELYLSPHSF